MSQPTTAPGAAPATTSTTSTGPTTRALLVGGAVAGPLFLVVVLLQVLLRDGFEPARHPLSLLSLGGPGWIQITNFVVTGVLFTGAAVGLRRVMRGGPGAVSPAGGPGAVWAPRLIGVFGLGLVAGGVFVADPAFEFPPGTPPGTPEQLSWHGIMHGFAPLVAFLALVVACFVFARRFARQGRRGWSAYSLITGLVVLPLSAWPNLGGDPEGRFLPLWAALVVGLAWASAMPARLLARTDNEQIGDHS
jgi:hypothetical protein